MCFCCRGSELFADSEDRGCRGAAVYGSGGRHSRKAEGRLHEEAEAVGSKVRLTDPPLRTITLNFDNTGAVAAVSRVGPRSISIAINRAASCPSAV